MNGNVEGWDVIISKNSHTFHQLSYRVESIYKYVLIFYKLIYLLLQLINRKVYKQGNSWGNGDVINVKASIKQISVDVFNAEEHKIIESRTWRVIHPKLRTVFGIQQVIMGQGE